MRFLEGSFLEKYGKIWKNGRFSGRLRPDWGHTTRVATAGLGSIGLSDQCPLTFGRPTIFRGMISELTWLYGQHQPRD